MVTLNLRVYLTIVPAAIKLRYQTYCGFYHQMDSLVYNLMGYHSTWSRFIQAPTMPVGDFSFCAGF